MSGHHRGSQFLLIGVRSRLECIIFVMSSKNVDPTLFAQPDESRPCFASGEEALLPSTYSLLVRHRYTADKLGLRVPNAQNKKSPQYANQGDPISQAHVSTSLPIAQQGVLCAANFIHRDTTNTTQYRYLDATIEKTSTAYAIHYTARHLIRAYFCCASALSSTTSAELPVGMLRPTGSTRLIP